MLLMRSLYAHTLPQHAYATSLRIRYLNTLLHPLTHATTCAGAYEYIRICRGCPAALALELPLSYTLPLGAYATGCPAASLVLELLLPVSLSLSLCLSLSLSMSMSNILCLCFCLFCLFFCLCLSVSVGESVGGCGCGCGCRE